jgi:hypothetical protein
MSQDDPKHEEHLHENQDDVAGTDEQRFKEQQEGSAGTGDPGEQGAPAGKPEGEDDDPS